jgi:hypothetical protein
VQRSATGLLLVTGLALALPVSSLAQARLTGADLGGTIRDQTGAVVPGCTLTVTNVETNITRQVSTDSTGRYNVPALPPGTYTITAVSTGFRAETLERVDLQLGQAVAIDVVLFVAGASETITVAERAPPLSVSRTEISSVINQQQIDALPTNGRNFIGFALIAPGVSSDRTPLQGAAATSGLSFTGQRGRSNNIMVDGLDNNDPFAGSVRATFSQEAIREFQVLVDSYSAEFGKAAGGVVNIVTKSGTNTLHGGAFHYFRDKALNAKKYFDRFDIAGNSIEREKPPFRQRQSGATLGGPLQRNKTFFFLSFEHTDVQDARLVTIDSAAAALLNRIGFPVETGNEPLAIANTELVGKVDRQWAPTRALTLRGNHADVNREGIDDYGGIVARSRGTVQLRRDWSVSAAETDVWSNRWINELRAQYANQDQRINALDPLCGGPCTGVDQGGPSLEVTGLAAVGRQRITPQVRLIRRLQLLDTISYFNGAHHIKAGVEYNRLALPTHGNLLPGNFGGRYFFGAIPALGVTSALDGLVKGIPAAYAQGYGNPHFPDERHADLSLFAQDEWKRGRFVVKPGVRYQRQFWQPGTFRASDAGGSTISFPLVSDRNNLAPRLGVTYDVGGDARTIARGSYGLFYDNIALAVETNGRLFTGAPDGLRTLLLPAPLASVAWNAPGRRLGEREASALLGGSYVSLVLVPDPSLKNPLTHQASVGVDRTLTEDLTLGVNAIYVRGFNLTGTLDFNPILPTRLGAGRRPNDVPCTTAPNAVCVNGGIPGTSTSVIQFTSFGESWYRGLIVSLNKRHSRRHQFLLSYTLSRAEDTSTDFQSSFIVQNNGYGRNPNDRFGLPLGFDPHSERGPATHDQRHRLVFSGVYQFPWNIQLSSIVTAASGRPFTPLAGADLNGDGNGGQFPPDRARRNPPDESSSVGRNSETTAAQTNVDVRFSKRFKLKNRGTIEAMVEAFNLFNRTNFVEDTNQSSFVVFGSGAFPNDPLPAYGKYTVTLPPRQVQLAARVTF